MANPLSLQITDPIVARTVSVLDQIFPSPRNFTLRLWDGSELSAEVNSNFSLVLNHPGALRRMFTIPVELSLAEAFIYGDFDLEGDIFSVFPLRDSITRQSFTLAEIVTLGQKILSLPKSDPERPAERGSARMRGKLHSLKRDRAAIQYHYDVGNDFYSLWLDRNLQYSCAYFLTGTEDIDSAQERKLEYICRKLRLKPGERLLDIGCGWGGLAMYAAKKYNVRVLGVTLSERQADYTNYQIARAGLGDRASVKFQDYRERGGESFDKIVSVGMFEHVGRRHLLEYFAQAFRLLKPGGLFLNHGVSRRAATPRVTTTGHNACCGRPSRTGDESGWQKFIERRIIGAGSFIQRRVFPDSELVPVSEVNLAAEQAGFEVRDVENLREHYVLTLRHWVNRLEAHQADAINTAGEVIYRTWWLYIAASAYGLESGLINVNQTLLAKPDQGNSGLPLTRADWYFPDK